MLEQLGHGAVWGHDGVTGGKLLDLGGGSRSSGGVATAHEAGNDGSTLLFKRLVKAPRGLGGAGAVILEDGVRAVGAGDCGSGSEEEEGEETFVHGDIQESRVEGSGKSIPVFMW